MISWDQWALSEIATAVFPTAVGPSRTGTLAPAKPALQLLTGQLHNGCPAMYVVRGQIGSEQVQQELAHFPSIQRLPRFDGGPAGVGGGKSLEPIGPPAESATSQVRHHLAEAGFCVEAGVRCRDRVYHHSPAAEPFHLESHSAELLAVDVDRVQLLVGHLHGKRQQQPLCGSSDAAELGHDCLVENPLVGGMLIHDDDSVRSLVDDVAVENLKERRLKSLTAKTAAIPAFWSLGCKELAWFSELRYACLKFWRGGKCPPVSHRDGSDQRPQGRPYRFFDHALYSDPVAKPDLQLGGMNVDVDILGSDVDAQVHRRTIARVNCRPVAALGGSDQEGVPEWAAVDKELGSPARGLRIAGPLNVSAHPEGSGSVLDRHQGSHQLSTPHGRQSFWRFLIGRHTQPGASIGVQFKPGFGVGQRE